jgi:hypothetical protein
LRTRHLASIVLVVLAAALPPLSAGCIDDGTPLPIVPRVSAGKDAASDAPRVSPDSGDAASTGEPDADGGADVADSARPDDAADGSSTPDAQDSAPPADAGTDAPAPNDAADDGATGPSDASADALIDVLILEAAVLETGTQ